MVGGMEGGSEGKWQRKGPRRVSGIRSILLGEVSPKLQHHSNKHLCRLKEILEAINFRLNRQNISRKLFAKN